MCAKGKASAFLFASLLTAKREYYMSDGNTTPDRADILDAIEGFIFNATNSLVEEASNTLNSDTEISNYKRVVLDVLMGEIYTPIAFGDHEK
jgi:hypothetical protein